jgi:cytochrome c553
VAKGVAARMIVEGRARLATPDERTQYQTEMLQGVEAAKRRELVGRAQVRLLSDSDIEALRGALKPAKSS